MHLLYLLYRRFSNENDQVRHPSFSLFSPNLILHRLQKETVVSDQGNQASEGTAHTGKVNYSLKTDGRKWKVANEDTQEQLKVTQYILENEQPENVTELFTVAEMTDINITPAEYFSQFITELQNVIQIPRLSRRSLTNKQIAY